MFFASQKYNTEFFNKIPEVEINEDNEKKEDSDKNK